VHWLGEGDLEQARQRLRDCYLFGLVEHFQDFLSSFSRLTGITVRTLNIQNATRERTHRNPELIEQFNRSNADDLALYEWARQWLTKHDLLGEKPVPQTAPTSTGDVGLAPTQDAIRVLIDNGQWQQAAERIAQLSDLTSSHYVHLGNLYKQMGRPDLATPWYEKSCAIDRDAARWLAPHYRQTDPQKANELLQTTLAYFADVPSTLEQSYLNRFRAALRQQLD
jgi:tetratricopeptide (TPR) repeat protein